MPVGIGRLNLKGGVPWGVKKKKKKKAAKVDGDLQDAEPADAPVAGSEAEAGEGKAKPATLPPTAVSVQTGKAYEQEFATEMERAKEGKTKNTPWGSTFRAPPAILHGYSAPVTGKTAQERLDMRCATKSDKFAK